MEVRGVVGAALPDGFYVVYLVAGLAALLACVVVAFEYVGADCVPVVAAGVCGAHCSSFSVVLLIHMCACSGWGSLGLVGSILGMSSVM